MRYKIRLYSPHDMDLIALSSSDSYNLGDELKKCIISYAKGEAYTPSEFDANEELKVDLSKQHQLNMTLAEKNPEEAAAIGILENIRPGYQCAFIKALFRNNSVSLPLSAYDKNGSFTVHQDVTKTTAKPVVKKTSESKPSKPVNDEPVQIITSNPGMDAIEPEYIKAVPEPTYVESENNSSVSSPEPQFLKEKEIDKIPGSPEEDNNDDEFGSLFDSFGTIGR